MEEIGYHVIFKGRVQGVGFRFTVRQVAQKHSINGWVTNTQDGNVEAYIQGDRQVLGKVIGDIKEVFRHNINEVEVEESPVKEIDLGFHVRF